MELVLLAAGVAALTAYAHRHPAPSYAPLDTYTGWLVRRQKPSLHR